MYYLYIDESGDPGNYLDKNEQKIKGSSRFFTLAGIIVNEEQKEKLNKIIKDIIGKYFKQIQLPNKFKLHYYPLRNAKQPYDKISYMHRNNLVNDVFDVIKGQECFLLSVTIDLMQHCKKYDMLVDPKSYAMLIMLERFQYFLEEQEKEGIVIYERFNKKTRKKVERTIKKLQKMLRYQHYKELKSVRGHVKNGDPQKEPILQISDFFAYAVWGSHTGSRDVKNRIKSIQHKYYNLNKGGHKSGNVII